MPKNKKKFIPKKNAVTFQLVHRSQQDPLVADEKAPQHVLKECMTKKNKEEEHKYGIFFDDEYDYMQHLKPLSDTMDWEQVNYIKNEKKEFVKSDSKVVLLPSSVFQSQYQESIGLLNKAAPIFGPRPELDPDIVAAMDDDFDYNDPDNILEENFIQLASGYRSDNSEEGESDINEIKSQFSFEENKSRFTDYSMTSSVIRRNEQLTLLDSQFEKIFEKYDDEEIGSLPCEDIEGNYCISNQNLFELNDKLNIIENENDVALKKKTLLAALKQDRMEEETTTLIMNDTIPWDCESVLSTYSNLYNHPAKICEPKDSFKIKINKKTGAPEIFEKCKLTTHALSKLEGSTNLSGTKSVISYISELSIRPKNETPQEKKNRKQALKEFRRDRRIEKKSNTLAFKNEKSRQEKILLNLKNNQGKIKLM